MLILSSLVQDFNVDMDFEHETENSQCSRGAPHKHEYNGTKTFKILLDLKKRRRSYSFENGRWATIFNIR